MTSITNMPVSTTDATLQRLDEEKTAFRNQYPSEEEFQHHWAQHKAVLMAALNDDAPRLLANVPRSSSYGGPSTIDTRHHPCPISIPLDRDMNASSQSAPAQIPGTDIYNNYAHAPTQMFGQDGPNSSMPSDWTDPFYTLSSANDLSKPHGHSSPDSPNFNLYSPAEFVPKVPASFARQQYLNSPIEDLANDPVQLSFQHADFQYGAYSSPSDSSASNVDTPESVELTPCSTVASQLSREHSSAGTSFNTPFEMLRVDSEVSACSNVCTREDSLLSTNPHVKLESANSHFHSSPAVFVTAVNAPQPSFSSYGAASTPYSQSISQSDLGDMQRSTSQESETSVASTQSRCSQRKQEVLASASRPIAPKGATETDTLCAPSQTKMVRIKSQDGSSKDVAQITKAPYIRPQHPKTLCPHCDEYPGGFRGEHELRRHVDRKHTTVKKVWVTVDASPEKRFLANCKQCRNKKQYGAYYNAAAHLRRAHFHPRKRGRKGKHDSEKRGGKGGGDHPAMDLLKQYWMKEIEVHVTKEVSNSKSDRDVTGESHDGELPEQPPYNFTHSHIIDEQGLQQFATTQLPLSTPSPTIPTHASAPVIASTMYPQFDPSITMVNDFSAYNYNTAYSHNVAYTPTFDFGYAQYDASSFDNASQQ